MKTILSKIDDATIRMEQIILLAGMINDGYALSGPLRDFLDEEDSNVFQSCFPDAPAELLEEADDGDGLFSDHLFEWIQESGKLGFLIQFARPVMRYSDSGMSAAYSWGYYATRWVYGDTLDAAVAKGLDWAAEREAKEKAKAADSSSKAKGDKKGGAA